MECIKCKNEIEAGTVICPHCGQDQTKPVDDEKVKLTKEDILPDIDKEELKKTFDEAGKKAAKVFNDSDRFFSNVGEKLCKVAKVVFWVGVIFSGIGALAILFQGLAMIRWSFGYFLGSIVGAAVMLCIGVLVSWLSSLSLYAYGDLVRRVQAIEERSR